MNHKRGRPKNRRAGCLCCKPHKMNGARKLHRRKHRGSFVTRRMMQANTDRRQQLDESP